MADLITIWRGRSGRLWRLRLSGVPLVPGGDPQAEGEVVATTDLAVRPRLRYGDAARRYGGSVVGSELTIQLKDAGGSLQPLLDEAELVQPSDADPILVTSPPILYDTPHPSVTLDSGIGDALSTYGFSGDLDAERPGYRWEGYLVEPPRSDGDERARPAPVVRAVCGLADWRRSLIGTEPGLVHRLRNLFILPGSGGLGAAIDAVLDGRATNRETVANVLDELGVLATEARKRSEAAEDLLESISHRLWRPFDRRDQPTAFPGLVDPDPAQWRIYPRWAPPLSLVAGDPQAAGAEPESATSAGTMLFGASERPLRADVPAEVRVEIPTAEPTYVRSGTTDVPAISFSGSEVIPGVDGLLPNGDMRHARPIPEIGPVGFEVGGGIGMAIAGGERVAELNNGSGPGWLWREAWLADPSAGAGWKPSRAARRRAEQRANAAQRQGLSPSGLLVQQGTVKASLRLRASNGGQIRMRLFLRSVSGTWYAGAPGGGWTALAAAPIPGDASPSAEAAGTFVAVSAGESAYGILPDDPIPMAGTVYVEVRAAVGSPWIHEMACLISLNDASGTNAPTADGGDYTPVDDTTLSERLYGRGDAVELPPVPSAYVTAKTEDLNPALAVAFDAGIEADHIESATTGLDYPDLGRYALSTAVAMRGTASAPPRIEERPAFGLVSPDHLVTLDGRRYVVQACDIDLRDEVTEQLLLYQVPVWSDEAWDWTPQLT
ncbi:MAG: hypothetical protein AAF170_15095 [Bacteroidota bacterium]